MRRLEQTSGPWVGWWRQRKVRGSMRLALRFAKGKVEGEGEDLVGPFTIAGVYDAGGGVGFSKRYPTHIVDYEGKWDGAMIHGKWQLIEDNMRDRGQFELWPEDEVAELNLESIFQTQVKALPSQA